MTIRAVIFDLWETLITNPPEVSRLQENRRLERLERLLRDEGHAYEMTQVERAHRAVWRRCQELYWSQDRDVPCSTQIEHFLESLGVGETNPRLMHRLEDAYAMVAVEIPPKPIDGAAETLSTLRDRGYRLGLISNTGRTPGYALREVLVRLGLADALEVMVFSNEHGFCKPETTIFEEVRRPLGVRFDEMVFVGDNIYVDVHGAQRCGMRAVHFHPPQRGTAVAPDVEHDLEISADATIDALPKLVDVIERWMKDEG